MDITPLFKASVKMVKTLNKNMGSPLNNSINKLNLQKKPKDTFTANAKQILHSITEMKKFLEDNRKAYIDVGFLRNESSILSDSQRDYIDNQAQTFIQTCLALLKELRQNANSPSLPIQVRLHNDAIVDILHKYLKKGVCDIYSEQKAIRVKRACDKQNLSRISVERSSTPSTSLSSPPSSEKSAPIKKSPDPSSDNWHSMNNEEEIIADETIDFTPQELQTLKEENDRLYEEMNSLSDVVKKVEGQVVEIVKLQEIFTEKVLEQEQDINRIQDTIVNSTENIREGNEEIREAMKKNAGFRVWILFFIIVLSFTMLFLDWYNP